MAKKISQLAQATQVKSDDVTVIVQDGETKKLPLSMMVTKQDIEDKKVAGLAKLDEIEATYENDTYTPTITVKNKSSVKTGEGDEVDYSANVMDGHVKSAILSGQTLVNIVNNDNWVRGTGGDINLFTQNISIKKGQIYTVISKLEKSDVIDESNVPAFRICTGTNKNGKSLLFIQQSDVVIKQTFTNNENDTIHLRFFNQRTNYKKLMIIEGDYANVDIPYFEGMQSVKMPVLKTTGKNLFDGIWSTTDITYNGQNIWCENYIEVNSNTTYYYSRTPNGHGWNCTRQYDADFNLIYESNMGFSDGKITLDPNTKYIKIATHKKFIDEPLMISVAKGEGYEPYKSNILTVNEDVTLRGIGDVQDTLDLLTGELTQRIGEIVLDGVSIIPTVNRMENQNNTIAFDFKESFSSLDPSLIHSLNDTFPDYSGNDLYVNDVEGLARGWDAISVRINKDRLAQADAEGFKQWLQSNPITVQCQLTTESVKTVDLMPSGTHPSTTPYCWKNGLIQLSSSGLLPNLEYSVVTSRAGQINQNATMIVKNDKRIFDLEILLAGGLVNTTYQALTLQNQVETGLSKVSLNSETEPDYLLYHMIMKLIEEKVYKLDDLTEKVSVFYLYEKLSDEQFETIYSTLYPFVEDEIVEEPVVEELPEVVEDEVIM